MNTTTHRNSGTRRRGRRVLPTLAILGATLLTGCQPVTQSLSIGDMASAYNREIWWMSIWAIALSIIIFIGVSYALFYTVVLSVMPVFFREVGAIYFVAAAGLGGWLLVLSWRLYRHVMAGKAVERKVAVPLYLYSMLYLALLFVAAAADRMIFAALG